MKKTISINIGGVIFYIEEDGYDKLRNYLGAVHKYFSAFSDSTEILTDIEGRIAERFLLKQKSENKQVISEEDVSELIRAMGTVSDFEAAEKSDTLISEPLHTVEAREPSGQEKIHEPAAPDRGAGSQPDRPALRGKFYRDLKRKMLGGVAAGLAHYYSIDPLWVRLLMLIMVFALLPVSRMFGVYMEGELATFSGLIILLYIAVWIAFPASSTLEENLKVKKFYRDPDRKVIGGVASGIGSYFNVDTGVVRFIWVISIFFFGTGILVYVILWAIAPAAKTLTEKMEMQGEPITLSNIESNIRRSLRLEGTEGRESDLMRLLLLPFRAIAYLLNVLGRILRGFGPIIRILVGVFLVGSATTTLLALLIAAAVLLGLTNVAELSFLPIEFMVLRETPFMLILSVLVLVVVPVICVLLLGLMLLANRKVVGSTVWITLAGLWIASIIGSTSLGISFQRNFAKRGEVVTEQFLPVSGKILKVDSYQDSDESIKVRVQLAGMYLKDSIRIEKRLVARGKTRAGAEEMAARTPYDVALKDSVLLFPEGPSFDGSLPYRAQRINITLYVPYHQPFALTRQFFYGAFGGGNVRSLDRYNLWDLREGWEKLRWTITPDSGLICLNMPEAFIRPEKKQAASQEADFSEDADDWSFDLKDEHVWRFPVDRFEGLELGGSYKIRLRKGSQWTIATDGSVEGIGNLRPYVENGVLRIRNERGEFRFFEKGGRILLDITTPDLKSIDLSGASHIKVEGFDRLGSLSVDVSGASRADLKVDISDLNADLTDASRIILYGEINHLRAGLSGASLLTATGARIHSADLEASGASRAELGEVPVLRKSVSGASSVSAAGVTD